MIERGQIRWVELAAPTGSEPGYRRPAVVISSDAFNASRVRTTTVAMISSNDALARAPGNVSLPAEESGLPRDSVVNVSQIATIDKRQLGDAIGHLPGDVLDQIDAGLRLALDL